MTFPVFRRPPRLVEGACNFIVPNKLSMVLLYCQWN